LGVKNAELEYEATGLSFKEIRGRLRLLKEASGRLRRLYSVAGIRDMGEDRN
jgi:hypothetical protein